MKKVLTIFCALLFTLPAVAAPAANPETTPAMNTKFAGGDGGGSATASTAVSQLVTISGVVVNQNNEPLHDATIAWQDNNSIKGTTTDINGEFKHGNVPADADVSVSFVGQETKKFKANKLSNNLSITMKNENTLDEIVVIEKALSHDCKERDVLPENAKSGTTKATDKSDDSEEVIITCIISECETGFDLDKTSNTCVAASNICKNLPTGAKSGVPVDDINHTEGICKITACKDGFNLTDNKCISVSGPCEEIKLPENAISGQRQIDKATAQETCLADKCKDGFEVTDGKCIAIAGDCPKKMMPKNATAGQRQYDTAAKKETCVATSCADGYKLANGACAPEISEEESAKKVDELRANATAMKEKEQSDANKLLGGAAIGAAGIGASQFLSGTAEKNADADAERDMAAYLATFKCDYGAGQNIKGGDKEITLPGGNDLMPLYNEYKALAAELKATKVALGMTPGIESETIFDKANTGLYDNDSLGRQSGAYASVSDALSNPAGTDATEWNKQKSDAASKAKTGAIVAGVGIVGGAVGNMVINSGKNAAKENSDKINDKYDAKSNQTSGDNAILKRQADSKDDLKKAEDKALGEIDKDVSKDATAILNKTTIDASAAITTIDASAAITDKNTNDMRRLDRAIPRSHSLTNAALDFKLATRTPAPANVAPINNSVEPKPIDTTVAQKDLKGR